MLKKKKEKSLNKDETSKKTSTISMAVLRETLVTNRTILIGGVILIGVLTAGSYTITNIKMNKDIESRNQELSALIDNTLSTEASEDVVSEVTDTELEAQGAMTISASLDTVPQELVDAKEGRPFKNSNGWYLVDTDGDFVGDAYWDITQDEAKSGTNGKMYLYSNTKRRWKSVLVQKEDKARGIKEKWASVLDMEQVIPPEFLLPAQYYDKTKGTVLDWSTDK